ncbi:MAG: hypothetical protein K9L79_13570 [Methylobacter tundripaludum]|nr:hypothetical protein [Methylobacter tundripaludum]MCK9638215.1 hypothetical protein [Methylobacter tundripaludum]
MIDSVGGAGGGGLLTAVMKEATAAQNVEFALIKKSQDIEKANGESALKLIASATAAASSGGIDIHV